MQEVRVAEHEVLPLHLIPSGDSQIALPSPRRENTDTDVHALRHTNTTQKQKTYQMICDLARFAQVLPLEILSIRQITCQFYSL